MKAEDLPEPTTALEARFLTILKRWLGPSISIAVYAGSSTCWSWPLFIGNSGTDMMNILVAAIDGKPRLVRMTSDLFRHTFVNSRETYEALKPFIRLTKKAEEQLMKNYALKAAAVTKAEQTA